MNYEGIPQAIKVMHLENAVISYTAEELARKLAELGKVEMTARALGTACRFCGIETVRTLVEGGATFDIPKTEAAEQRYHCYSGMKWANYRTNYALLLLNTTRQIKGSCCCKGLKFLKRVQKSDGAYLKTLSDSERAKVLSYLYNNKDKISFEPSEMLYYAIFMRDDFIVSELEKLGVKLLDKRVDIITNGGPISDSYWYEWVAMTSKLDDGDYLPVMERIKKELGGKPFHCTAKVYDKTKIRFGNADITEFFRDNFKTGRLNKTQVIRDLIDADAVDSLAVMEKLGWLGEPRRRDEMISYAQQAGTHAECLAWLLDFKNRTADIEAERKKAERKAMREFNADPYSATAMKRGWGFEKQADGTLVITRYKGVWTEIDVPSRIGKNAVTAIGEYAFSLVASRITPEQAHLRERLTRVTIPDGIRSIGKYAFYACHALEAPNIPDSVVLIDDNAFSECYNLKEIIIPDSVTKMGNGVFRSCAYLRSVTLPKNLTEIGVCMFEYCNRLDTITLPTGLRIIRQCAFKNCEQLREIVIPEGVTRIEQHAFANCDVLRTVVIPASVTKISNRGYDYETVFAYSDNVTVFVEPGSYAEEYCKQNKIAFKYIS